VKLYRHVCLATLSQLHTAHERKPINAHFGKMWKEAVVTYFMSISQHLSAETNTPSIRKGNLRAENRIQDLLNRKECDVSAKEMASVSINMRTVHITEALK
jgi:hypothetical protein